MLKFLFINETTARQIVQNVGGMIVLLNSSINPLVYCWRIKEIRRFVDTKVRGMFGVSRLYMSDRVTHVNQVRPVNIQSYRETPV